MIDIEVDGESPAILIVDDNKDICNMLSLLLSDKYKIMKQRNWQCDITPVMKELGYVPEYDLEKGVKEAIAWYKNEGWL